MAVIILAQQDQLLRSRWPSKWACIKKKVDHWEIMLSFCSQTMYSDWCQFYKNGPRRLITVYPEGPVNGFLVWLQGVWEDVTDVGSINGLDLGRSGHGFKYQLGKTKDMYHQSMCGPVNGRPNLNSTYVFWWMLKIRKKKDDHCPLRGPSQCMFIWQTINRIWWML